VNGELGRSESVGTGHPCNGQHPLRSGPNPGRGRSGLAAATGEGDLK